CSLAGSYRPWCCGRDILVFLNKNNQPRKRPNAAYMANARPTCGQTRGGGGKKIYAYSQACSRNIAPKSALFSKTGQDGARSHQISARSRQIAPPWCQPIQISPTAKRRRCSFMA